MDNVSIEFQRQKDEIELSLARIIYTQLDQDAVSYDECKEMAQFVLARIDAVVDHASLMTFLEELSVQWPVFESLKGLIRLKVTDASQTEAKLKEVQQSLNQLTP